jgi:hypothetical protein
MDKALEVKYLKRTQRDYSYAFKMQVVSEIEVGISATGKEMPEGLVSVFPNPAQCAANFRIGEDYLPRLAMLTLYNATGSPYSRSASWLVGAWCSWNQWCRACTSGR